MLEVQGIGRGRVQATDPCAVFSLVAFVTNVLHRLQAGVDTRPTRWRQGQRFSGPGWCKFASTRRSANPAVQHTARLRS